MIITLGNVQSRVDGPEPELAWLEDYLSFDDATAHFRRQHGYRGDGKIHCFNRLRSTVPSGFLRMVQGAAAKEGFQVQVVDRRARPCEPDPAADLGWLRDYQREAVDAVLRETRGILHIATGGGKTEVFAGLSVALPCRWLFLVHRNQLVDQAADRVELRTPHVVGRVREGRWASWDDHQVICASFQSLHAALKHEHRKFQRGGAAEMNHALYLLEGAQGICVDECHVAAAETYLRVVSQTRNAYWRVGLSGTPLARGDKRAVLAIGALEKVIYRLQADALVQAGVLAKPKIRMVPVTQESDKPTYQGTYGELVVRSTKRNRAVVEAVRRAEKPCLVFVKELKHGKELERMLEQAGLRASFVSGQHSTDWRKSHVRRLEMGSFDALIASVVFQEGIDIPDLRSVVVACAGTSTIAALQRIGRGMRKADGKDTFEVWDVKDEGCKTLARQAQARMRAYIREKFEVTMAGASLSGLHAG